MSWNRLAFRMFAVLAVAALFAMTAGESLAQNYGGNSSSSGSGRNSNSSGGGRNSNSNSSGGGRNSNSNSNSSGNSSDSSGGAYFTGGVSILPDGVLQRAVQDAGALTEARADAMYQGISSEMKKPSRLRKVSLNRLEETIKANGGVISDEMANLAGLYRIENVFVYPESGDIVLAGPAEGWVGGTDGAAVGSKSGLPTLQLADLAVALRAYPAEGKPTGMIGCSIDPSQDGLAALQSFLQSEQSPNVTDAGQLNRYADGIYNAIGLQEVKFWGVSPKTHFAATLVAADYRMKLIGIGLEPAPVKMTTYIEKSNPNAMAQNALVRWFFQPDYQCVVKAGDNLAIALRGDGVNLVGEDELVTADGKRVSNGRSNRATKLYAKSFTDQFSKIAKIVPVYASLRNLIDMSVVAAWLQKEDVYGKTGWKADFLTSEASYPLETAPAIEKAEPAVNIVAHGQNTVSFPTGGGVLIEPVNALSPENLQADKGGEVAKAHEAVGGTIPEGVWWWD